MKLNQITLSNIWAYITGNIRFWFFGSKMQWAVNKSKVLQVTFRLFMMDDKCYSSGQCKMCGCKTLNLQFASKRCKGDCYPEFMRIGKFVNFLNEKPVKVKGNIWKLEVKFEENGDRHFILRKNGEVVNDKIVTENKLEEVQKVLKTISNGMYKGDECNCPD